jgi:alkylation response protein AidB-like acyl-CoA dehydrogenase
MRPEPKFGPIEVADCFTENADGFEFSGTRLFVPFATKADWFLSYASSQNGDRRFFLIPKQEASITPLETIAADKQCEVIFEKTKIPFSRALGNSADFDKMLEKMNLFGSLGESAYILGMLGKVLEMTTAYAKQRKQFGKFIGQFQAIQHQCADMAMAVEQVRLLTYHAAWKLSHGIDAKKDVAMAKAKASQAARQVPLRGITVHGGIGIIDEYDLQLYFRRAKAKEVSFGDADDHRESVAAALGL